MSTTKSIPGRPGTAAQPTHETPVAAPPPGDGSRVGKLQEDAQGLYVRSGNLSIRIDPSSVRAVLGGSGGRRPSNTRAAPKSVPGELAKAIDVAKRHADSLRSRPGVVAVRAGYKFVNGEITDTPCVVVAVDELSRAPSHPSELEGVQGLKRAAGARFLNAFAKTGAGQTFASAYHIKVAVQDDSAFWLSSGNWQSSNQPDTDFFAADADRSEIARYNREWHVVIESPALAQRFQTFLEHDFETARSLEAAFIPEAAEAVLPDLLVPIEEFMAEEAVAEELEVFPPLRRVYSASKPLTVQPILTPDNYISLLLDLLRERPASKLYFQNQSLNPIKAPTAEFAKLMDLLAQYSNDADLDVRIIFRNIGPVRKKLESLKLAGFNMKRVRLQGGCHTKGIVIDGETLLVGSHNWTNQGTQVNRDASVLIRDKTLARYYERIFLHDWDKLARSTIRHERAPRLATSEEAAEAEASGRYVRVPWSYYEED